jgi:transposase
MTFIDWRTGSPGADHDGGLESTGVYWIPVFEILEQRGLGVMVVNARDAKHVPGRKTDVCDAQWLQRLHEYGLLRASFRPQAEMAGLRTYLRQRERRLDYSAAHIQHMQKAPDADEPATSSRRVRHHRSYRHVHHPGDRCGQARPKGSGVQSRARMPWTVETMCQALVGNYREEYVFALTQALELYDVYQTKVMAYDKQIQAILTRLK